LARLDIRANGTIRFLRVSRMKAVILVGGEGTRLRPLTCNTTKAMVPVLNKPFLEHLFGYLKGHGIIDIILAMSYLPQGIKGYFGDGTKLGVSLSYLVEEEPMGTAGAAKNAESHLDESFLMLNGDIFTDLDITAMIDFHRRKKAAATIAVTPVDDPTAYGLIETDADGRISRFREKPAREEVTTNTINAGVYVLEPDILAGIPPGKNVSIERETFQRLLEEREPVYAYSSTAYWLDMGTPEKYLRLNHDLLLGRAPVPINIRESGQSRIDPSATIEAPVLIGEGCAIGPGATVKGPAVLGPGCKLEEGAIIEGAVLWNNVSVGRRAIARNCIAASHSQIHEESEVPDNCVLGDRAVVGRGSRLPQGTRIRPDKRIGPGPTS
jgi:mannose-1-phosphate guanylyltransferase